MTARTSARSSKATHIRVVVAEQDAAYREQLLASLASLPNIEVTATAQNSADAVIDAYQHKPDVVLLDLTLPGMPADETTRHIMRAAPDTSVCLLAASETEPGISAALDAGARECLKRNLPPELILATFERLYRPR